MMASSTTPPASTAWTSDSGATAMAATWKIQAPVAINMPIANNLDANSALAERQRMADVHGGRRAGSPMLEQEADVRRERAGEREQDAEDWSH